MLGLQRCIALWVVGGGDVMWLFLCFFDYLLFVGFLGYLLFLGVLSVISGVGGRHIGLRLQANVSPVPRGGLMGLLRGTGADPHL